jgi:hypothetical protein
MHHLRDMLDMRISRVATRKAVAHAVLTHFAASAPGVCRLVLCSLQEDMHTALSVERELQFCHDASPVGVHPSSHHEMWNELSRS